MSIAAYAAIRMPTIRTFAISLCFAAVGLAAESTLDRAGRLVGRWESLSFKATNLIEFNGATNLIFCVYKEDWLTNATTKRPEVWLDVQLRTRDGAGLERSIRQCEGHAAVGEQMIVFGLDGPSRFSFGYRLTNNVMSLGLPGALKAELKRVSLDPGERMR